MEQKKILWAVAAAGAFLLVVIGAAMIIYNPFSRSKTSVTSVYPIEKNNSNGWVKPSIELNDNHFNDNAILPPQDIPHTGVDITKAEEVYLISDNTTVYDLAKNKENDSTTIDLNNSKISEKADSTTLPQNINITVNIPNNLTPSTQTSEIKQTESNTKKTEVTTKAETNTEIKQSIKTAEPVKQTVVAKIETPKVEAPKTVTKFWVQIASYSNKKSAEGARLILSDNKIPSDIFTYNGDGNKLYYRVRIGPYTTKSEASYWQNKILKIKEFEKAESYVTSTQAEK